MLPHGAARGRRPPHPSPAGERPARREPRRAHAPSSIPAPAPAPPSKPQPPRAGPPPEVKQEIAEEILALEAIYGDDFSLDADGVGFRLRVVPHPGDAQAGFTSAVLHVR
jgi:hypothetical protein